MSIFPALLTRRLPFRALFAAGVLGAGALSLAAGAHAFGHGHGRGHGRGHGMHGASMDDMQSMMKHRIGRMLDKLDATDAQRASIDAILERTTARMKALHDAEDGTDGERAETARRHRGPRAEMLHVLTAAEFDRAEAEAKLDAHAERMKAHGRIMLDALGEVRAVLTPEQREKLATFAAKMQRKHDRRGHHGE